MQAYACIILPTLPPSLAVSRGGKLFIIGKQLMVSQAIHGSATACCILKEPFNEETFASGDGPYLRILVFGQPFQSFKVLGRPCDRIHRILQVADTYRLLVAGGSELCLVEIDVSSIRFVHRKSFMDRILDVAILSEHIYVVLAHGQVHIVSMDDFRCNKLRLEAIPDALYMSAAIVGKNHNQIYIALGSIFNGVFVVPSTSLNEESVNLIGPEGSVYGLDVLISESDDFTIAAASDDRSVCVWKRSANDDSKSFECFVGWGHSSRVWRVKLIDHLHLISAGEDGTVRLWKINCGKHSLECICVLESGYSNQSIWAVDIKKSISYPRVHLLIGGDDGSINFWKVLSQQSKVTQINLSKSLKSFVKAVGEDKQLLIFACLEDGSVIRFGECEEIIYQHRSLQGYSKISVNADGSVVAVGAADGTVHVIRPNKEHLVILGQSNAKVQRIWASENCIVWLNGLKKTYYSEIDGVKTPILLETDETTSVLFQKKYVAIGCRNGMVHFFHDLQNEHGVLSPFQSLTVSAEAVKDILQSNEPNCFLTIDWIGNVSKILVDCASVEHLRIDRSDVLQHSFESLHDFNEQIYLTSLQDGHLVLSGLSMEEVFRRPRVVHRFSCNPKAPHALLAGRGEWFFATAETSRTIKIERYQEPKCFNLRPAHHGVAVRAVKSVKDFFLTGGEDGYFRAWNLDSLCAIPTRNLSSISHRSSIICMDCISLGNDRNILATGGGLDEVFLLSLNYEESLDCNLLFGPILPENSIQARILSIACKSVNNENGEKYILVATASSDGEIRIWLFNPSKRNIILLHRIQNPHGERIPQRLVWTESRQLLSTGTDGSLNIFIVSLTDWSLACHHSSIHQSGINALACGQLEWRSIIVTGGDDGCVKGLFGDNSHVLVGSHNGSVIGVAILKDSFSVVSVGIDQRVHLWKYIDNSFTLHSTIITSVSDPASLCLTANNRSIVIGGANGFEVIRLDRI